MMQPIYASEKGYWIIGDIGSTHTRFCQTPSHTHKQKKKQRFSVRMYTK